MLTDRKKGAHGILKYPEIPSNTHLNEKRDKGRQRQKIIKRIRSANRGGNSFQQ
jgi:hypothetical protein